MTSQFTRRGILLLSGSGILAGKDAFRFKDSDFWNTKESDRWSSDEVDRLITKSPWAKQLKVSVPLPPEDAGYNPKIPGVGDRRPTSGTGGMGIPGLSIPGLGGRGGQSRGNGQTQFEVIVRWESAKPVQEAIKTPLPEVFANHYVLSLSGIPNTHAKAMKDPVAYLEGKGLRGVKATEVQRSPGSFAQILFGFPVEPLHLSADDQQITFTTDIAKYPIRVNFRLTEMMYHGSLAV